MPDARRTRSLVCAWGSKYAHEYSQRGRRDYPTFPTQWFTAYAVLSLAIGLSCHHRLRKLPLTNLTPASRRQDHTSSPSASAPFVIGTVSVHRIPPRVRDDREPPLKWDGTARISEVIWVGRKEEFFFAKGAGRQIGDSPVGQNDAGHPGRLTADGAANPRFSPWSQTRSHDARRCVWWWRGRRLR
jgi:hypothetical protein